jgi:hypothetical protein
VSDLQVVNIKLPVTLIKRLTGLTKTLRKEGADPVNTTVSNLLRFALDAGLGSLERSSPKSIVTWLNSKGLRRGRRYS